jgi:hypothetical protein
MSTNNFAGLSADIIAQAGLKTLLPKLAGLQVLSTDFSADVAQSGETVVTRIASPFTASTYAGSYASSNAVSEARSVTLGEPDYVQIEVKPKEAATYSFDRIVDTFLEPAANAVVKSIFDKAFGLVTSTNLTGATPVSLASDGDFDRSDIIAIATQLSSKNVAPEGRSLMLSVANYGGLVSDNTVAQVFSLGGSEVMRNNNVGRIHGLDVYETSLLGGTSFAYESGVSDLGGIAGNKSSFIVVNRAPAVSAATYADFAVATDPDSGFSFAVMKFFDPVSGKHFLRLEWLTGVALGNKNTIVPVIHPGN